LLQIKGPLAPRVFEAHAHLRLSPFLLFPQRRFDKPAHLAPRAVKFARSSRLVLAQQTTDFGECAAVRVVVGEAQAIARLERAEGRSQRYLQDGEILCALRIGSSIQRGVRCSSERGDFMALFAGFFFERFGPARSADFVDVALRENGAQPRAEFAAAVEIIEERFSAPLVFAQAVKIGVERIGKLACVRLTRYGARGAVKFRPKLRYEKIPCCWISVAARTCKGEIGHMERFKIGFDRLVTRRGVSKAVRDAALERPFELRAREIPARWRSSFAPAAIDGGSERSRKSESSGLLRRSGFRLAERRLGGRVGGPGCHYLDDTQSLRLGCIRGVRDFRCIMCAAVRLATRESRGQIPQRRFAIMADEKSKLLYLDDVSVGQRFISGTYQMDLKRMKEFAEEFDPQRFHLDDEAAQQSIFRGLAASGWHTAAATMRLSVLGDLRFAGGLIGLGGEIEWPRPTRAGDTLRVETEILEIVPSRSKPNQGIVRVRSTTVNQHGEPVQIFTAKLLVPRRP